MEEKKEYYQTNALVEARKHYGIIEHRIFRLALSYVNPHFKDSKYFDENFKPLHLDSEQVKKIFGNGTKALFERIKMACQNMIKSYIEVGDSKNFLIFPVFEYIEFKTDSGLDLKFNEKMKPFILELYKGNYTKSFLQLSFSLDNKRALTLLELMLQYSGKAEKGIIEREILADDLKFYFDIGEDKYKGRMNNFRYMTLNPAIKAINEKTTYYIEPEYITKYGRYKAIQSFIFRMHLPKKENIVQAPGQAPGQVTEFSKEENIINGALDERDVSNETIENKDNKKVKLIQDFTEEELKIIIDLRKIGIRPDIAVEKLNEVGTEFINYWLNELSKVKQYINSPSGFIMSKLDDPDNNRPKYKYTDIKEAYDNIQKNKRNEERRKEEEERKQREEEQRQADERRAKRTKFNQEKLNSLIKIFKENNYSFPEEYEQYLKDNYWTAFEFHQAYYREIHGL